MIRFIACFSLFFCVCSFAEDQPPRSQSHILYVGEGKLIGIRFDLSDGKQGLHEGWLSFWQTESANMDKDGDKKISPDEWNTVPVLKSATAPKEPLPLEALAAEIAKARGPVSLEKDTQQYYSYTTNTFIANSELRIFDALDLDKSKKLERGELSAVFASLKKQDLNDDDNLNREELVAELNMAYQADSGTTQTKNQDQFILAGALTDPAPVVDWLIRKLDQAETKDGQTTPSDDAISIAESGLGSKFGAYDTDGDQKLSRAELTKLVEVPPAHIVLEITLGASYSKPNIVQNELEGGPAKVRSSADGATTIILGRSQIEIVNFSNGSQNIGNFLEQIFRNADRDNNKYLEKEEVRNDYYFREMFEPADLDKDGKLFPEELQKFIANFVGEAAVRCQIQYRDFGRDVFELLDANRDRRLSQRELNSSSDFIDRFDTDADGGLRISEIGQHFRLVISSGEVRPMRQRILFSSYSPTVGLSIPTGPSWFQKMDRNLDGEISPREFIGNREKFQKLDTDQDGLITSAEADQLKPGQ